MAGQSARYHVTSDAKHVRQIVVRFPADAAVPSRLEGCFYGPSRRGKAPVATVCWIYTA